MKLAGEEGESLVFDSFDGLIVGVAEPDFPARFERFFVNSEAVILAGDIAAFGFGVYAWLVLRAVTKF